MTTDFKAEEAYIDPYAVPGLLWPGVTPGADDQFARARIDDMMTAATSQCVPTLVSGLDLRAPLRALLKLDDTTTGSSMQPATDVSTPAPTRTPILVPAVVEPPLPAPVETTSPAATDGAVAQTSVPASPPASGTSEPVTFETPVARASVTSPAPQLVVGSRQIGARWTVLGRLSASSREPVALDLDQPKVVGIFGYMGSGKSYLLGALAEAAVQAIPNLNELQAPLAVVIFNYRRNASDRFELSSLANPNSDPSDVKRLVEEFGAKPAGLRDLHILALRGELNAARLSEYAGIPAQELQFRPSTLGIEDWELLMGEPDANRLYSQLIRHGLVQLREQNDVSVAALRTAISAFPQASRNAAAQRLTFAERHLSETGGINFSEAVQPGRVLIIDLRQPLFTRDDALRFFLVCANQISRVQGNFNKMIIFDEAHEYLSESFGEKLDSRIRLSRHEGTSYVFATQDVGSIPTAIQRFISTKCVFGLGSHQNVKDLLEFAPEFKGFELIELSPGQCFVQSAYSHRSFFSQPRLVRVRPRASAHGGATRIFN